MEQEVNKVTIVKNKYSYKSKAGITMIALVPINSYTYDICFEGTPIRNVHNKDAAEHWTNLLNLAYNMGAMSTAYAMNDDSKYKLEIDFIEE